MDSHFKNYFLSVINTVFKSDIFYCIDSQLSCELVLVKSFLFGNRLISLGYLTDGGIMGDTAQPQDILLKQILELAHTHKANHIEFRGGVKPDAKNLIIHDNIYANFTKDFSNIDDVLLAIPRKKRADIRKALGNPDLKFTDTISSDEFYTLFSGLQHQHGTPIHYKKYYKALCRNPEFTKIYGIKHQHKIVAVCMVFFSKTELIAYYGAADREYVGLHVYDLLYYHLMGVAKEKNLIFNFGRSKYNTGSFLYKTLWGFEPQPTTHYIIPVSQKPIPDLRANNPEFSRKIALWRKMPRWFVNIVGGFILKQIG
jgi:FemAB-related protein (PEP-CTERM system-associated)